MALGFNSGGSGGGQFLPIIKYDARSGRMFKLDRVQGATGWESTTTDITDEPPTFAIDFLSIEIGWVAFLPTGPSFAVVPAGQAIPQRPSNDHKEGFRVKVYGPKQLGGVREFSSSSKAVKAGLDQLHDAYSNAPEAAEGKIPIVQMLKPIPVKTTGPQGSTTNYAPSFQIVQWLDRPAELGEATVAVPARRAGPVAAASPPPAVHVPPSASVEAPPPQPQTASGLPF